MAEIEMEVDTPKPSIQGFHVDDDFIDFDTDMTDQPELVSLHSGGAQKLTEAVADPEDDALDAEQIMYPEEEEADVAIREEADLGVIEDLTNNTDETGNNASHTTEPDYYGTEHGAPSLSQQPEEEDGYVDIPDVDGNAHNDPDEAHASDHEIDYELGEQADQHESHGEVELDVEENPPFSSAEAAVENNIEVGVVQAAVDAATKDAEGVYGGHSDIGGHQEQAELDEITYDDGDDRELETVAVEADELASAVDAEGVLRDELDEESHAKDESVNGGDEDIQEQGENHAAPQHEDANALEYGAFDAEASVDDDDRQDVAEFGEEDPSVSGHMSVAVSEPEFPAITVQYKGDEFPFFSDSSDGFFTETSILDESVEKLLSGFRDELGNEIAHDEELVFQVDELGLEFAESCSWASLSSVTLRQILEIFDLLVKNQDPDSSRNLYTYLFTRPCASKRLESLIESATAGKGLEEVIHLFQSPVAAGANMLDTITTDDGHDDKLEDFESPADEVDEAGEISKEDAENDAEHAEYGIDLNAPVPEGNQNANEGDQDATEGDDTQGNTVEPTSEDAIGTDDQVSHTAATEEHVETNAHDESESDPFINLELDDAEVYDEVDLEVGRLPDEQSPMDPHVANVGTADTSTTTTLKDEDDTGSVIVDANASATGLLQPIEVAPEDDVGEVDWRDEPEANDEAPTTPSAAGKRARGDDEVDAEDEQDVKRRRP